MYCFGQEDPFKEFYVVDSNIYKNKVKTVLDTFHSPPKQNTITEYDTLGREVLFYYTDRDFQYRTTYENHADTILSFLYLTSNNNQTGKPIEIRKSLYNEKGKVVFYAICYKNSAQNSAQMRRFFYDSLGRLSSVLFYYVHKYPFDVNEYFSVKDSLFNLQDVEHYYYNDKNQLSIIKQMIGPKDERFIDSFFYDRKGKLIRQVKFQKYGSIGKLKQYNISYNSVYTHTDSSWFLKKNISFDDGMGETGGWSDGIMENVFMPNGLLNKQYLIYNTEKELYRKFEYNYFN